MFRPLLLLLLLLPTTARAQLQAPNESAVVHEVAERCPGLILQDHAFTDAVATVLHARDNRWGRNGKRGNPGDLSHDALAFTNPASPFGVSVVDIIGAAGSRDASPAWIDQTQATIDARTTGVWVRPSGVLPVCMHGGPVLGPDPPPVDPPPPVNPYPPTPTTLDPRIAELLEEVLALHAHVAELRQEIRAARSDMHALVDRQTRRIFGVLVETDGTRPAGLAEDVVNGIWERNGRDRLRVKPVF